ncbi:uncharacterized protein LOC125425346 [Sphaerodactylus townsendi]|uniref:uncharacterized protein LOC125425346 n=1 Tax=Sphaerodactylus townsendi TaxID=933632 RepID=UPI002025D3F3|nr:uncharacterized protein LOC125425346 [Sphaerodactylus townsendi]
MKCEYFYEAVDPEICCWAVMNNEPCTIAKWIKVGSFIADQFNRSKGTVTKPQPTKQMLVSAKKVPTSTTPSTTTSETTSERCCQLGLCLYCCEPGHMAANCPKKAKPGAPPKKATAKPPCCSTTPKASQGTSKTLTAEELDFPEEEEDPAKVGLSTAVPETSEPTKDAFAQVGSRFRCLAWPPEHLLPVLIDGHKHYEISTILDSRMRHQRLQYLVSWVGFPTGHNQWVSALDVSAPTLVTAFHKAFPHKAGGGGS